MSTVYNQNRWLDKMAIILPKEVDEQYVVIDDQCFIHFGTLDHRGPVLISNQYHRNLVTVQV